MKTVWRVSLAVLLFLLMPLCLAEEDRAPDASSVTVRSVLTANHQLIGSGSVISPDPILKATLTLYTWPENEAAVAVEKSFALSANKLSLSVSSLCKSLWTPKDSGGKTYRLVLDLETTGGTFTFPIGPIYCLPAHYAKVPSLTDECAIDLPAGRTGLTDGKYTTSWESREGNDTLRISCPDTARKLQISWNTASPDFTIECFGENVLLATHVTDTAHRVYRACYDIPAGTDTIVIKVEHGSGIAELDVFDGEQACQDWQPLPDKVDLMVFTTHPDDELLWFGGAIPSSVAQGKVTAVAYMTTPGWIGWVRRNECLNAMWNCGVRYHPLFMELRDDGGSTFQRSLDAFESDGALENMVATIRRYKPDVIVTHDTNGEYGHSQHKATSYLTEEAVRLAADETYDTASLALYGTWQVKKLYIHLSDINPVYFTWSDVADESGLTSYDMAWIGFDSFVTQQAAYSMEDGYKYDNHAFGLVFSTVGLDEGGDSMFEHLEP